MGKIRNFLRNRDEFGHAVTLNFNRNGDTFNTVLGGLVSLSINIFLFLWIVYKAQIMFNYGSNTVAFSTQKTDFESLGKQNLNKTGYVPFWLLNDAVTL